MTEAASHSFPLHGRDERTSARLPFASRLRLRVTRSRLDRQIAAGCPCDSTAALALRASQLVDPRTRLGLARNLRGVVDYVDRVGERPVFFSAVVINRLAVRAARETIVGLVERLEGTTPVNPRGVVLARALLTDGIGSPLFNRRCDRTVAEAVWEVADALGADPPTTVFDAVAC